MDGFFSASKIITITAGINIYQSILKKLFSETIVSSAWPTLPLLSCKKKPVIKNKVPAIRKAGVLTYSIDFICSIKLTFDNDAVITVVSDNGESLSPT